MPHHEPPQNLGFTGHIASAAGRINRFNPAARVAGAVLGRVGVSNDSIVGKALNIGGTGHASIHEGMAHRMAHSRVGKAVAHAAGAIASRDPIIRHLAKKAQAHGMVGKDSPASHALGLNRNAGGLAGAIAGMKSKASKNSMAGAVHNAQFESKHHRVHGRFQ